MESATQQRLEALVSSAPVLVFMKGNKLMPQCGFSNNVVQIYSPSECRCKHGVDSR